MEPTGTKIDSDELSVNDRRMSVLAPKKNEVGSKFEAKAKAKNLEILSSFVKNGILSPKRLKDIEMTGAFSSATSSENLEIIVGNTYDPDVEADFNEEAGIFTLKEKNTGRTIYTNGPNDRYIWDGESDYGYYNDYLLGKETPAAQFMRDIVEGWPQRLYEGGSAILPVLAERPWIKPPYGNSSNQEVQGNLYYEYLMPEDEEERMKHSILCASTLNKIANNSLHNMPSLHNGPYEYNAIGNVPLDDIDRIIVPDHLKGLIAEIFPQDSINEKCSFVSNTRRHIKDVYRKFDQQMQVPDYESSIRDLTDTLPHTPLWLHGIRLLTAEDVANLTAINNQ